MAAQSSSSTGSESPPSTKPPSTELDEPEHFRPTGTLFILGAFVLALILLWLSVYVILISRGVTA